MTLSIHELLGQPFSPISCHMWTLCNMCLFSVFHYLFCLSMHYVGNDIGSCLAVTQGFLKENVKLGNKQLGRNLKQYPCFARQDDWISFINSYLLN